MDNRYIFCRCTTQALTMATVLLVIGCQGAPTLGPPAQLLVDASDTLVVNNRRPVQIPARVLDSAGHDLPITGVRYERTAGPQIPVSTDGAVTCTQSGDATIRVSLEHLATTVLLRCRPVQSLHMAGRIRFLLPDSARELQVLALGLDSTPVTLLAGTVEITNTGVATLDGQRIQPRSPGSTIVTFTAGDESVSAAVHVFERVRTLDNPHEPRMVAVSHRLASGEWRRWPVESGNWSFTMLPYEDEGSGLQLWIENAHCMPNNFTPQSTLCLARSEASVVVYHPSNVDSILTGELLLWRRGAR